MSTTEKVGIEETVNLIRGAEAWAHESELFEGSPRDQAAAEAQANSFVRMALSSADDELLDELGRRWFDQPIGRDTARILASLHDIEDVVNVGALLVSEINGRLEEFELDDAA